MKIAIIGAGTMGSGIAQTIVSANHDTLLISDSEVSVAKGITAIKMGFDKAIAKGRMSAEQKNSYLSHLKTSTDMNELKDAEIVIEAVPEDLNIKRKVLVEVERVVGLKAIIATNTSSISINSLSNVLSTPSRFIGMHFFNPAPVMKLIEIVKGEHTSTQTVDAAIAFGESLGKTAVEVMDFPGFISNRILMAYINESINALDQGVATVSAIDTIAKLGFNHPIGPLELADFIGLDVCKDIMNAIYMQNKDSKFIPAPSLIKLVNDKNFGRKTGKGFYDYKV